VPSLEGPEDEEGGGNKRKRGRPTNAWRLPSGAPVVPQVVYHNVENALVKFNMRKRKEFVQEACKYWTLKREARRGAALLKRLQLQMDSFSSMEITRRNFVGMGAAGRPRLARRIDFAERLDEDMERIRKLCQLTKQREAEKLKDILELKAIIDTLYFPINGLLEPIIDRAFSYVDRTNCSMTRDSLLYRFDGNHEVFKAPLQEIQTKLNQRYYTSVQAFSDDLTNGISSVIGFAKITDITDANNQLNGVEHKSLTAEQKEQKKLAKRIFKALQPLFNDAFRAESDLSGRPHEREVPDLEALLDMKLQGREAASTAGDSVQQTIEHSSEHKEDMRAEGAEETAESVKGHNALHLAPTPEDNPDDHHLTRDEAADEAAIAAQLGQDALHANGEADHDPMDMDAEAGNARAAPPTPPGSDQDLLGPIHHGGIPWYMTAFEPEGTTVYEEKWTGRDRAMSEELSELDEEELDRLGPGELLPTDGAAPETVVSKSPQKGPARKRVRRR
jgi:NuA3 HAT complex component NTO1